MSIIWACAKILRKKRSWPFCWLVMAKLQFQICTWIFSWTTGKLLCILPCSAFGLKVCFFRENPAFFPPLFTGHVRPGFPASKVKFFPFLRNWATFHFLIFVTSRSPRLSIWTCTFLCTNLCLLKLSANFRKRLLRRYLWQPFLFIGRFQSWRNR